MSSNSELSYVSYVSKLTIDQTWMFYLIFILKLRLIHLNEKCSYTDIEIFLIKCNIYECSN